MATRMLQRRGTAAAWAAQNSVLADGEIGMEQDTLYIKIGDGVTPWNDLQFPFLRTSGGVLSGPLVVNGPLSTQGPLDVNDAATIQGPLVVNDAATIQGPVTIEAPTDPTHAARLSTLDAYLKLSGGTMTGALSLIAPAAPNHAARNVDVDTAVFGIPLRSVRTNRDANNLFTTVEMFRPDGTKAKRSVLSGGTSPQYTTRTVTEYEANGTTVRRTTAYTLSYDADDNLVTEVFV